MDAVILGSRLFLAGLFALAGVAKLAEPTSFRRTLPLYGVPGRLVGAVAIAVPVAELTAAVALVPAEFAPWGAVAALALLTIFTGAAAVARVRGVEAECACFGPLDPLSIGARPFIRNIALAAVAVLVVAAEADAAATEVFDSVAVGLALMVGVLVAWLALSARKRGEGRMSGTAAGTTTLPSGFRALTGETIHLRVPDGTPTLLLFWSPYCPPCQYMLPRLKAWENDRPPGSPRLVIASSGSEDDNRATGLASPIFVERSDQAREAFAVPGRPAAVLIDGEGRVVSEAILGAPAILAALRADP